MKPTSSKKIQDRIETAALKAMREAMGDLQSQAVNLAPIDTGDLRSSAHHDATMENGTITGRVSFDAPYARVQHEGFFDHPGGGQRKYLETPFRANAARYGQHIAREIKRAVER